MMWAEMPPTVTRAHPVIDLAAALALVAFALAIKVLYLKSLSLIHI